VAAAGLTSKRKTGEKEKNNRATKYNPIWHTSTKMAECPAEDK